MRLTHSRCLSSRFILIIYCHFRLRLPCDIFCSSSQIELCYVYELPQLYSYLTSLLPVYFGTLITVYFPLHFAYHTHNFELQRCVIYELPTVSSFFCPCLTTPGPLNRISWNFMLRSFAKICWHIPSSVVIGH